MNKDKIVKTGMLSYFMHQEKAKKLKKLLFDI